MISFSCQVQNRGGDCVPIDLDMTTSVLEPEKTSSGGLFVPGKDRLVFRPPERKSLLGMIYMNTSSLSLVIICLCFPSYYVIHIFWLYWVSKDAFSCPLLFKFWISWFGRVSCCIVHDINDWYFVWNLPRFNPLVMHQNELGNNIGLVMPSTRFVLINSTWV